ncbi:MAG: 2-succinyl-6-hydroxy-2,4-cyclohexadiene-1-carboxylate synthase [Chloroflexi bacterium]|nr:2-succinyl-6-hydroxy-2,4-cyclohexadiene-1-carboxylate synthase [Chloroflexota bacterium]
MALDAIGGAHLNVERAGTGPEVVAIHGFTGSTSTWSAFAEAARGGYTVISVDVLGHGSSASPTNPDMYSMERTVRALAELLDKLGVARARWLGYSMGGRIVLSVAIALPHRTAGLVVESGSPGLATAEERAARVRSDEALARRIEDEGIEAFVRHWESLPLWASQARLPEAVRESLRAQRLKNSEAGLANSLRGIGTGAQPPLHHRLAALQAPTLFIAGAEDAKFAAIAQEMHGAVPNSRLQIVPNAGHAVHLEAPGAFNRAVLDFLKTAAASENVPTTKTRSLSSP